jgi:hypothetical protein
MPALIISIAPCVGLTLVISCVLVMHCCSIWPRWFHRFPPLPVRPRLSTYGSLGFLILLGRYFTKLGYSLLWTLLRLIISPRRFMVHFGYASVVICSL